MKIELALSKGHISSVVFFYHKTVSIQENKSYSLGEHFMIFINTKDG